MKLNRSAFERALALRPSEQIKVSHPVLSLWVHKQEGRPALTLGFTGDMEVKPFDTRGFTMSVEIDAKRLMNYLTITSREPRISNALVAVCEAAYRESLGGEDGPAALERFVDSLAQLKSFLTAKGGRLSAEQLRGSVAELLTLDNLIDNGLPAGEAVRSWVGMYNANRDFHLGAERTLEVKSIRVDAAKVRISNAKQLDEEDERLQLIIWPIAEHSSDTGTGVTLPELCDRIAARLPDDPGVIEDWNAALEESRLDQAAELYANTRYSPGQPQLFDVRPGFPRIISSDVPAHIVGVNYSIELNGIQDFKAEHLQLGLGADRDGA